MSAESDLYAKLSATAGVTALVGTRIYPMVVPSTVDLPAIAYRRISNRSVMAHNGPTGLERVVLAVDCAATTYAGVRAVADAVQTALNGNGQGAVGVFLYQTAEQTFSDETNLYAERQQYVAWVEP